MLKGHPIAWPGQSGEDGPCRPCRRCAGAAEWIASTDVEVVGVARQLVGAVAQHPGEAQRDAAGVARTGLYAVEGDLDDELGPHVHGVAVTMGLKPKE